jgi:hypothetical protein
MNARKVVVTHYTFPDLDRERAAAEANGAQFVSLQCRTAGEAAEAAAGASEATLGRLKALLAQDIERPLCGETPRRVVPGSRL